MSAAKRTPAKIAADLERTARGRNVRALLLCMLTDDTDRFDDRTPGFAGTPLSAKRRGLIEWSYGNPGVLTSLGCKVAAERIARLLTAADLARAKMFEPGGGAS